MGPALMKSPADAASLDAIVQDIRERCPDGGRITFLSGDFNIVHPGHLRLFNFASQCGEFLVVGVNADGRGNTYLRQEVRLHGVCSIGVVDYAFLLDRPIEEIVAKLRPDVVVKGREHADRSNPEQSIVEGYGGKLLFCSGDIRFSSLDLLHQELSDVNHSNILKSWDFPERHNFTLPDIEAIVGRIPTLNTVVVGDLIVDCFVTCEALGMSQEDPTIVVAPIAEDLFIGGAGIVAAHASQLGANTTFLSVAGNDPSARFAREKLEAYGVAFHLFEDETRPTTFKKRYRANGKTMLRVNELRQNDISRDISGALLEKLEPALDGADLLIFSDFSYGCLPQRLVDEIVRRCRSRNVMMFADSQVSSQVGDVSRFKGMAMIAPTELEARMACQDFSSGLVTVASKLQHRAETANVIVTLGVEGMLIHTTATPDNPLVTDRLPAFNAMPVDPSGAGDSLLACSALSMALGADIWKASYLGAIAAACQVGRMGNVPLTPATLISELRA